MRPGTVRRRRRPHAQGTVTPVRPRPVIWKPRYATRRMREQAWAKADARREQAAAAGRGVSWLSRLLHRLTSDDGEQPRPRMAPRRRRRGVARGRRPPSGRRRGVHRPRAQRPRPLDRERPRGRRGRFASRLRNRPRAEPVATPRRQSTGRAERARLVRAERARRAVVGARRSRHPVRVRGRRRASRVAGT